MSRLRNGEFSSQYPLAHPVDECKCGVLATLTEKLGKCGGQRSVGNDLSLDASGQAFGPRLAVTLHRRQALFFTDQCVDLVRIVLNTQSRTLSLT